MGRHAARVVIFVKASDALVPELPDNHDALYGITVHPSSGFQQRQTATWQTLKFSIPLLFTIPLSDEPLDTLQGKILEFLRRAPRLFECLFNPTWWQVEVGYKVAVRAILPVGRLLRGEGQQPVHQRGVEDGQKGTVKQQTAAPAVLGVAGKLARPEGQVALTLNFDSRADQGFQGALERFQDERVCLGDALKRTSMIDPQDQRIVQAPRALENGPAAATSPENGDVVGLTGGQINIRVHLAGVSQDDEVIRGLPKS